MTTFAIMTLGCKVNAYESQGYAQGLLDLGYQELDFKDCADIYIINTCAVTNTAAAKSRQKIHQAHRQNPNAMLVVVGCYAQSAPQLLSEAPYINLLIGSDQKEQLPELIHAQYPKHIQCNLVHDMMAHRQFEALPVRCFAHQTRAYLKIQDGCNQYCSYCIIPYTRGKERSLDPDTVLERARLLVSHDHLEIVLTGIHTGRYGREHHTSLAVLLKRLCHEVTGLARIRISSIEINEISDELLTVMRQEPKIARHLHIPLQSADNDVLKAMGRPYRVEEYADRVNEIRKVLPNISISADVITGFPQESDRQFALGKANIADMKLSFLHVFPFSKRDGTKAAQMSGQCDPALKKQRTGELMKLSAQLLKEYEQSFIKQTATVLWERRERDWMVGHTGEYLEVYAPYEEDKLHTMEEIVIQTDADGRLKGSALEVSG
ncbi:MAG: tRNA (N(6)-L-threonylcarbamoyladenosine(37)-C(2))-methylthiotransferase MtaB [Erysipelotrichaceae bacterium]|nr:tRNA (N(6)-L-threonylcarbamoyladenosine(37)-C(2))-methylthiotransferase MtaB [Erysipelotrichaceae bacterium]